MTFKVTLWAVLLGFMTLGAHDARAADTIEVQHPYAFATSAMQKNGAAFFTLVNHGPETDKLISASGTIAETIEMHTHMMDGDIMMMRKVDGYDIPADGSTTLKPMGHHIMLMGLHDALEQGSSFPLTLEFENAGEHVVDVQIIAPGTKPVSAKPVSAEPDTGHEHH